MRLAGHDPVPTPVVGTSWHAGRSSCPCGVRGHFVEGGGGGSPPPWPPCREGGFGVGGALDAVLGGGVDPNIYDSK